MLAALLLLIYVVALTNGSNKKKCANYLTLNRRGLNPTYIGGYHLIKRIDKGDLPGVSIHYSVTVLGNYCYGLSCKLACHYKANSDMTDVEYDWSIIKCGSGKGQHWKAADNLFPEESVPDSAARNAKDFFLKSRDDIKAHFTDYGELFEDNEGIE